MSTALILFAKAPESGFAKTRLIPALGADGAAALAHRMLCHAVDQAMATHFERVELCVSPDASNPVFQAMIVRHSNQFRLTCQTDGDLGQRMQAAIARNLSSHTHVMVMGTDAPALTTERLTAADDALRSHRAVFVPAYDGGYALIGLSHLAPFLFDNMVWSTSHVMEQTRIRLTEHGWLWRELEAVHDIDEPEDLKHLARVWLS